MASPYSIKFHNYTKVAFDRIQCSYFEDFAGVIRATSVPTEKLAANGGFETLAVAAGLQDLGAGVFDALVVWKHPQTNDRFGVKIHVPAQVFHIGQSPYYQVLHHRENDPENSKDWYSPVQDPAAAWEFPKEWSKLTGLEIRVGSQAAGQSLHLSVKISQYKGESETSD